MTQLAGMEHTPTIILLYNPAPYEIYRDLGSNPKPEIDQVSTVQRQTHRAFADTHGWRFLDLTEPLQREA